MAVMGALISLCGGTSFAKSLFPVLGAAGTTTYRIVFSALILLSIWRPWKKLNSWKACGPLVLYGTSLGAMNLLFYLSIQRIPFGLAIAIEFTGPLMVAIFTSRRKIDFTWVGLAVLGLGLILPLGGSAAQALNPLGIFLALAAGACWALYIIFGQRVATLHGGLATAMGMSVAALVVTPFGIAHAGSALLDPTLMVMGLAVALSSSAIPYSLEMYALAHLPKRTFSILLSMEPAVGAVAGWLVLHEVLSGRQWVAILCIMTASIGSALTSKRVQVEAVANG
jgi:inner membrane transporter RhtA